MTTKFDKIVLTFCPWYNLAYQLWSSRRIDINAATPPSPLEVNFFPSNNLNKLELSWGSVKAETFRLQCKFGQMDISLKKSCWVKKYSRSEFLLETRKFWITKNFTSKKMWSKNFRVQKDLGVKKLGPKKFH